MNFEQLLKFGVDQGASGIHLQAESTPQLRIGGLIRGVEGAPVKAEELRAFIASIAPKPADDDIDRLLTARFGLLDIARRRPVPLHDLQSDRRAGPRAPGDPTQDPQRRRAESAAGRPRHCAGDPGPHPCCRPWRQRKDNDPGRDGRPDQRSSQSEDRDDRGTGRISCTRTKRQ